MSRSASFLVLFISFVINASTVQAVPREWDNEGATQDWSDAANWSDDTVPLNADEALIGGLEAAYDTSVFLDLNGDVVQLLSLTNGADLDTNTKRLAMGNQTQVGLGAALGTTRSELIVRPRNGIALFAIDTDSLWIGANGQLTMRGGEVDIDGTGVQDGVLNIAADGIVTGEGMIDLSDSDASLGELTSLVLNDGSIIAGDSAASEGEPVAATLHLTASKAPMFSRVDLSGPSELGTVSVLRNATLQVDPVFIGPKQLTLLANATFEMNGDGSIIAGSTLEVNSGVVDLGLPSELPASPAVIRGTGVLSVAGTINVDQVDEELIVEARIDGAEGVINNHGIVRFRGGGGIRGIAINAMGEGLVVNESSVALNFQAGNTYDTPVLNEGLLGILRKDGDGTTQIQDYEQSMTGELFVDIAGLSTGEFEVLAVENDTVLAGALSVNLEDMYEPTLGDSFTILSTATGNVTGQFDTTNFPVFSNRTFELVYNTQSVDLLVIEAGMTLDGDFDLDGDVDGADFLLWQRGGSPNGTESGDLAVWQTNYGPGETPQASTAAVPEPATGVALVVSMLVSLAVGRRVTRS